MLLKSANRAIVVAASLLCTSLLSSQAMALDGLNYAIHQSYVTPRSLGLGGAMTAMADDYSAVLFNPAFLAKLESPEINLAINASYSPNFISLTDDLDEASGKTNEVQAITDALDSYYGENFQSRFGLSAVWARSGWGMAIIPIDLTINLGVNQNVAPSLNVEGFQDTAFVFAYAKQVPQVEGLSLGANVKAIYRGYVGKTLTPFDLADPEYFKKEDAQEGLTVDFDIGSVYEPKWWKWQLMVPTFALVVRNAIDYGFVQNLNLLNEDSTEPPKLGRVFDLGSAWQLPKFWVFNPRLAFDIRDIGHQYWTFKKGLHLGAELGWEAFSWLQGAYRFGLNQGYLTAGISAQFTMFRLDIATWGEEVGTSNKEQEDRRYALTMALDF